MLTQRRRLILLCAAAALWIAYVLTAAMGHPLLRGRNGYLMFPWHALIGISVGTAVTPAAAGPARQWAVGVIVALLTTIVSLVSAFFAMYALHDFVFFEGGGEI